MKKLISILIVLVLASSIILTGCGGDGTSESTGGSGGLLGSESTADVSETALNNFFAKLKEGNYTVGCEDGLLKASVYSKDLVDFYFDIYDGYTRYNGITLMTVNEKETFSAYLGEDSLEFISFADEGKAIDVAATGEKIQDFKLKLPSCLIEAAGDNVWDIFYNDVDEPLQFITKDDSAKSLIQIYAAIGDIAMPRMQDVYLVLDAEDPTEAHLKTSFTSGYPEIADVDLVIKFGDAKSDARAEAWMNDENREYPAVKTGWDEADVMNLNAIYLPGYGETGLPFPDFATYALTIDISKILGENKITVRDCKATQDDMSEYEDKLEKAGFTAATDDDGNECFRLLLREDYKCYSSLYLEYNDGATIVGTTYYDFPKYEGLDEINEKISGQGYPELPADDNLSDFSAVDVVYETTESWLYFFGYDTVLHVTVRFDDQAKAEDYIKAYTESLEGFIPDEEGGEEEEFDDDEYDAVAAYLGEDSEELLRFSYLEDEDLFYRLKTKEGTKTFKYIFNDDSTVSLLFKTENFIPADDVAAELKEAGFPGIDLSGYDNCRDHRKFQKTMFGQDYDLELSLSFRFETAEEADALIEEYVTTLKDEHGFDRTNPKNISMSTAWAYSKEEGGKLLVYGFDYVQYSTVVNVKFRVMDIPEEY